MMRALGIVLIAMAVLTACGRSNNPTVQNREAGSNTLVDSRSAADKAGDEASYRHFMGKDRAPPKAPGVTDAGHI